MMDPYTAALVISTLPVLLVVVIFFSKRRKHKEAMFFLAFVSITFFYIVAPDPSLIAAEYTSKGMYSFPIAVAIVSFIFLAISVFAFGQYTGAIEGSV